MNKRFLKRFIKEEKYEQNPPLETKKFIEYCKKLGLNTTEEELEWFEKEKLLYPIIRIERPIVEGKEETKIIKYYSGYAFDDDCNELLLHWLEEGNLFSPENHPFQAWASFEVPIPSRYTPDHKDNFMVKILDGYKATYTDSQKIVSFYSSFQIYWLDILKQSFRITIDVANYYNVSSKQCFLNREALRRPSPRGSLEGLDTVFNLEVKKKELRKMYKEFNKFLQFLLLIQNVYYPYIRSSARLIQLYGDNKKWNKDRVEFNLKNELEFLKLDVEQITTWNETLFDKANELLGHLDFDWRLLWEAISWDKKDRLKGNIRLGVEYFQWNVMLRRLIKHNNDIFPDNKEWGASLFSEWQEKKLFYDNKDKALFYLSNSFKINYQPKLILFVEGETEESILPTLFKRYFGYPLGDIGIDIFNLKGVNKLFGQEISIKDNNNKHNKKWLSNFNHLISYNLNKWQTMPFILVDNENEITTILEKGISISFERKEYKFPEKWKHIWSENFEKDNFTKEEINSAEERNGKKKNKISRAEILVDNLFRDYYKLKDENIFKRPIFEVLVKVRDLARRNHMPTDNECELKNKKYINNVLENVAN